MFIYRQLEEQLQKFSQFFPVVALLGPRQSGKTTLARHAFPEYYYLTLEALDILETALDDPRHFLEKLLVHKGVIIDEFQNAPQLLSYMQGIVDQEKKVGFFILTGSQNFLMNQSITQSLAGRVGILTLLPLSLLELKHAQIEEVPLSIEKILLTGSYPRLFEQKTVGPEFIYPSYIQTCLERDIRLLSNVIDLSLFKKFLGLCAARVGQLITLSSLASDCGISVATVNAWLSLLQASYIIFLLQPYHKNFNKRLIKSSKLYFYDSGIVCSLLSIVTQQQLEQHYVRGSLFENFMIAELYKQFYNNAREPHLYFWRDSHGHEVDCLIEWGTRILPIEIKIGKTIQKQFFDGLFWWQKNVEFHESMLIYGGSENFGLKNVEIRSWKDIDIFKELQ